MIRSSNNISNRTRTTFCQCSYNITFYRNCLVVKLQSISYAHCARPINFRRRISGITAPTYLMCYLTATECEIIYTISRRVRFTALGYIAETNIYNIAFTFQADIARSHPCIITIGRSRNLHIKFFFRSCSRFRLVQNIHFKHRGFFPICPFTIK